MCGPQPLRALPALSFILHEAAVVGYGAAAHAAMHFPSLSQLINQIKLFNKAGARLSLKKQVKGKDNAT